MKIVVLGAGVIGLTTAYMLARLGHDVSVIDKGADVASGASHANGAQLSYSHIDPLAGPATLKKLPGYLLGTDPAIRLGLSFRPDYLKWGLSFLRNCTAAKARENLQARAELAELSRQAMRGIDADLPPNALKRTGHGKIVLAQSVQDNDALKARAESDGGRWNTDSSYLTRADCLSVEPALADWRGPLLGGLYSARDDALDPVVYCKAIAAACARDFGGQFHFNEKVGVISKSGDGSFRVKTDIQTHSCDRLIVCFGNDFNAVLKRLDLRVQTYPMQGYSLTLPTSDHSPTTSITDMKNKIVFANLGSQMRIAGFMDTNQSPKNARARSAQLLTVAKTHWPSAADFDSPVSHWTHFRPMTPSGVPIIGPTKVEGLYINAGHGSLGYTFAAGSAAKISNEIGSAQSGVNVTRGTVKYADH